jgi:hypothetical protein
MRLLHIFYLLIILVIHIQYVFAESELRVTGKINRLEISDEEKMVKLSLQATLTFTNTSKVPLLIVTSDSPLICVSREIYGFAPNNNESLRLYALYTLPSFGVNEKTRKIQRLLNVNEPPSELIKTIGVGETLSFEINDWFYIDKEKNTDHWTKSLSWNEIKDAKSLSLRLGYRIWSLDFELRSAKKDERPFGDKLRKRWKKDGYLLLNDIVSEPIPLDLSSSVMKTESQP